MAITHTLLISSDSLKRTTTISQSVDDNLIHPVILLAQDRYILPVLGTDLFEKLKTEVEGTPAGNYETLLKDYVQKCLCQFTLATLYPVLRLRAVRHSVVQMDNEQGTSVSFDDIEPLISSALDMGEFYRERLIDYLTENSSLFPEYSSNTGADMSPTTRNYYSGINMDTNVNSRSQLAKAVLAAAGFKNIC
jgi:hypothetical protein|tara:strand:+ start:1119 stop:1694 length:576 start_codon:yes stop_codon:yes gene_type:complete